MIHAIYHAKHAQDQVHHNACLAIHQKFSIIINVSTLALMECITAILINNAMNALQHVLLVLVHQLNV